MSRKRKNVVKFPARLAGAGQAEPGRKMSEIVKEMALQLLRDPGAVPSRPAVECALLLATAAWNSALGELVLRNQHRDVLAKFDWSGASPWPELRSSDTDQMIADLVAYKKANYPDDERRIVAAGLSPEAQVLGRVPRARSTEDGGDDGRGGSRNSQPLRRGDADVGRNLRLDCRGGPAGHAPSEACPPLGSARPAWRRAAMSYHRRRGRDRRAVAIYIDDEEYSLREFGQMLSMCAGWGMRVVFVPEGDVHEEPIIEVRKPKRGR